MRAFVDADTCTACGLCEETCPEVFALGDTAAEVIADPVPADAEDCVVEAADGCPSESITYEE
ncbi:MAG: ferredoxin [Myxococcota bacterium]|jgi:ferredoxin|nr:ferredoxin [Myxococcota bacterium]